MRIKDMKKETKKTTKNSVDTKTKIIAFVSAGILFFGTLATLLIVLFGR